MLAIQKSDTNSRRCIPNILPCRIHYTGPTKVTKRFWAPANEQDESKTSYFRGRKLRGKAVKLPQGYQGMLLRSTDKTITQPAPQGPRYSAYGDDDDDVEVMEEPEEEAPDPVKILEQVGSFDEVVVWGHDQIPNSDDPFVRGMDEWVAFAEAIHLDSPVNATPASKQEDDDK